MRAVVAGSVIALGLQMVHGSSGLRAAEPDDSSLLLIESLPKIQSPSVQIEEPPPRILDVTPIELDRLPEPVHTAETAREGGLYGSVEYLLMRPRQRGLDYAIEDPTDDLVPEGRIRSLRYDIRSGFRVGLGYRLPSSGLEIGVFYTYLYSRGTDFTTAATDGLLYPTLTRPGLTDSATSAQAKARLAYNVYDLEFGRTLKIDEWMNLRLYTGLRYASIYQSLSATYQGRLADAAFAEVRSNFDGGGPIFGGETSLRLAGGLSVFGKANGGMIFGNLRPSLEETNNGGATIYSDLSARSRQIVPFVSLGFGLSWQYRGLTVRAGYETVNWFGLIQRPTLVDDFSEGKTILREHDLSLDGLFFQLGCAF